MNNISIKIMIPLMMKPKVKNKYFSQKKNTRV